MSEDKKNELAIDVALLEIVRILKLVAPIKRDPLLRLAMAELAADCGCPESKQ